MLGGFNRETPSLNQRPCNDTATRGRARLGITSIMQRLKMYATAVTINGRVPRFDVCDF